MNKQDKKGVITLCIIIGIVIIAVVLSTVFSLRDNTSTSSNITEVTITEENEGVDTHSYKKEFIASLYIEGVIEDANSTYNQKWLLDTIKSLKNNKRNAALAIYIDSPGGGVYQADEVYLALQDYKTTGRPIYVYQGPMSASGGYYISCAGDKIFANRNTLTGCIGVIFGQSLDVTELLTKLGIKSKTFHSGRNKTMLNPDVPLTTEQEEIMQSMCDEAYEQFVTIVANNRNMTYEEAATLSDGRLYTAKQALNNGLVDQIDSWENMLTILAEDELGKPGIKVAEFKKEVDDSFNILDFVLSSKTDLVEKEAASKMGLPLKAYELLTFDSYPAYLFTGL